MVSAKRSREKQSSFDKNKFEMLLNEPKIVENRNAEVVDELENVADELSSLGQTGSTSECSFHGDEGGRKAMCRHEMMLWDLYAEDRHRLIQHLEEQKQENKQLQVANAALNNKLIELHEEYRCEVRELHEKLLAMSVEQQKVNKYLYPSDFSLICHFSRN